MSYAQAESESAELARALLASGVGKGTRVGILFPNGPDWVAAFFAVDPHRRRSRCRSARSTRRASSAGCCATPTCRSCSAARACCATIIFARLERAAPGLAAVQGRAALRPRAAPPSRGAGVGSRDARLGAGWTAQHRGRAARRAGDRRELPRADRGERGARGSGRADLHVRQHRRAEGRRAHARHPGAPLLQRRSVQRLRARRPPVRVDAVLLGGRDRHDAARRACTAARRCYARRASIRTARWRSSRASAPPWWARGPPRSRRSRSIRACASTTSRACAAGTSTR